MQSKKSVKLPQGGASASAGKSSPSPAGEGCSLYSGGSNAALEVVRAAKVGKERRGATRGGEEEVADSDDLSEMSGMSEFRSHEASSDAGSETGAGRKRPRRSAGSSSEGEESPPRPGAAVPSKSKGNAKRGRGRPPTTGEYVGLAKAKKEYLQLQKRELEQLAEEEILRTTRAARELRMSACHAGQLGDEDSSLVLQEKVEANVQLILDVAKKSGHLKGTFIAALKEAAHGMKEMLLELSKRTVSEEVAVVQAENARLKKELEKNLQDFRQYRKDMSAKLAERPPVAPAPPASSEAPAATSVASDENFVRTIMVTIGTMMDAKLAGLEDRLLPAQRARPPLRGDIIRISEPSGETPVLEEMPTSPGPSSAPLPAPKTIVEGRGGRQKKKKTTAPTAPCSPPPAPKTIVEGKGKRAKKKKKAAPPVQVQPRPLPPAPASTLEAYAKVAKKGKKTLATAAANPAAAAIKPSPPKKGNKKKRRKRRRLRPPRTSAVVLTMTEQAVERGENYAAIIRRARQSISLPDIGISGLTCRRAVTGAFILEVPGATSGPQADQLAAKIAETIGEDTVRVSRPTKSIELRVSGLDDSVSGEEVAVAIATKGGCTADAVKVGVIRRTPSSLGTVVVRCPVAAARKAAEGRLLVGWTSAQVKLLEPRPRLCFRCHEQGHVASSCTGPVDRSDDCYRCGRPGHMSSQCTAVPHCPMCEALARPANHRAGGKACKRPSKKKIRAAAVPTTSGTTVVEPMESAPAIPVGR